MRDALMDLPRRAYVTPVEIAAFLGISDRQIRRAIGRKDLKALMIEGGWRVKREDVFAWIAAKTAGR